MKKTGFCIPAVVLALCQVLSSTAFAQSAKAKQTPARSVDVSKVFGFYDIYLRLPAAERDGFRMIYRLRTGEGGSIRPQLAYALGNVRTPIEVTSAGQIITMPDLNMFRNGKVEIAAGQPRGSINMDLEPVVPLARSISVNDAQNPISDYARAVSRAGPLAAFAPKLNGLAFQGVSSGEVIFGDGRRVSLSGSNNSVTFRPSLPAMRGATSLVFPSAPSSAEFVQQ
jgi:hypothetical protein